MWVFIDDKLFLDVGGIHGVMYGKINFSTGMIEYINSEGKLEQKSFASDLGGELEAGTHVMSICYLERGSSQSNCTMFFNVAPRFEIDIVKEDIFTREPLDGAVFEFYTDESCEEEFRAQLWESEKAYHQDMEDNIVDHAIYRVETVDGQASCWGLVSGMTYYIKETKAPDTGLSDPQEYYPDTRDNLIRVTLNNRGTSTIEAVVLRGDAPEVAEGYAVIEKTVDDENRKFELVITNQLHSEPELLTSVRVRKSWDEDAVDIPNSITVNLLGDGKQVSRPGVLTDDDGWTYVWEGLPKYSDDSHTHEVDYTVQEVQVPGFKLGEITSHPSFAVDIDWVKSSNFRDNATFMLINNGKALAYDGSSFEFLDVNAAQELREAQWDVSAYGYGFKLTNKNNYTIAFDGRNPNDPKFIGVYDDPTADPEQIQQADLNINRTIYYIENRLIIHHADEYWQFSMSDLNNVGTAVTEDGLVFAPTRRDDVTGKVIDIENELLPNEEHTFVQVNKVWDDDEDHSGDSITVHLYANNNDTNKSIVLNQANNWQGRFDGLSYGTAENPITYTVLEDEPDHYDAMYASSPLSAENVVTWTKASAFVDDNKYYRISNGSHALGVDPNSNDVIIVPNGDDPMLWWEPIEKSSGIFLKHVQTQKYLDLTENLQGVSIKVVSSTDSMLTSNASRVKLNNGEITVYPTWGDDTHYSYLLMTQTKVSATDFDFNATLFTVATRFEAPGQQGTRVVITNVYSPSYMLPMTGGAGTPIIYAYGTVLTAAPALMYICKSVRKRRREGG